MLNEEAQKFVHCSDVGVLRRLIENMIKEGQLNLNERKSIIISLLTGMERTDIDKDFFNELNKLIDKFANLNKIVGN